MEKLKKINRSVKAQQLFRLFGGIGLTTVGLNLLYEYFEHSGWTKCQQFIHRYYPEEYDAITEKIIESYNKH